MRVVTWNIQTGRPNPDGPSDLGKVIAHLRSLDADVCAIQEVDRQRGRSGGQDQPTALAEGLDGRLVWAPTVRKGTGEYGVALVVRGEVVRTHEAGLSGTREPRTLLVAEVDLDGARWTIGCTHLSRRASFAERQLVTVFDVLAAHPPPRVLLGDLNLVRPEILPWSTAEGYHLVDGPPTHSTRQASVTRRIDHVLVQGAIVAGSRVHQWDVSDHRAVSAELTRR